MKTKTDAKVKKSGELCSLSVQRAGLTKNLMFLQNGKDGT